MSSKINRSATTNKKIPIYISKMLLILASFWIVSCSSLPSSDKHIFRLTETSLIVDGDFGSVEYTSLSNGSIEVHYLEDGVKQLPSFSIKEGLLPLKPEIEKSNKSIALINGDLRAEINWQDLSVTFYRSNSLLVTQSKYNHTKNTVGFDFEIDSTEKIMGGGERVLGMDRRGHRLPLYNRAHYGYTTESDQMNYSLPLILSSKKYAILFDNTASGFLDIAKTKVNNITFEAKGGRTSYIVFSGANFPKLINNYVDVTGKQPMPARWTLGSFASRFGYRNQQEVEQTVAKYKQDGIPLDAIILDLYWFGKDIKGYMGNLSWDKEAFPHPTKMLADLNKQGVKPILITEPFVLSSSTKWQEAVDKKVLAKDENGDPKRFDFYFGNTGLVDVFDRDAQDWFANIYTDLTQQGVGGVWGDLGEPEVHPDDTLHHLSQTDQIVRGDEIHNAYGHQWLKMVYQNQLKQQPEVRPFILMRSGFAGSQRYGIVPWTGDVSRSWGGLKPQVELSLQMGLSGLAYTHSDLGGFAGDQDFDPELYIRWLEYGVFQPIYRPHAQDVVAPEPVFRDEKTKRIIKNMIELRYRLLPYNYNLAHQNSTTGMPLMRPLFFENEDQLSLYENKSSYFWGDSFLVSPVVEPKETIHKMFVPEGIWFDFWNDKKYVGGKDIDYPTSLERLPVLVRSGALIPMVDKINNTQQYSSKNLTIHYYYDPSVTKSHASMYEDDGKTFASERNDDFEILKFSADKNELGVNISLRREGAGYPGMPNTRRTKLVIHNWLTPPNRIMLGDSTINTQQYDFNSQTNTLTINLNWKKELIELSVQ